MQPAIGRQYGTVETRQAAVAACLFKLTGWASGLSFFNFCFEESDMQ